MATAQSYTREYGHLHTQSREHSVRVTTTLYDVIRAVSDQIQPGEEHLVAPAVELLLRDCGADFLSKAPAKNLYRPGTLFVW